MGDAAHNGILNIINCWLKKFDKRAWLCYNIIGDISFILRRRNAANGDYYG